MPHFLLLVVYHRKEGKPVPGALVTLVPNRTRDGSPQTQQARSFGAGITRPAVPALSLFPFPVLAHPGLPGLLARPPLSLPNPVLPTTAPQTVPHPFT